MLTVDLPAHSSSHTSAIPATCLQQDLVFVAQEIFDTLSVNLNQKADILTWNLT